MESANFVENIASRLGQNASVKNVYGDPIVAQGKTIIPVAKIAYGFGGGFGKGKNKNKLPENKTEWPDKPIGEGGGGGGGLRATPVGVYEVNGNQTKFIPANNNQQLLIAAVIGFLIRGWLIKRRRS